MNRFDFTPYRRSTVGFDRLFEQCVATFRFLSKDALRVGQFGLVSALRLLMRHDPSEVRVNDQHRIAARTTDLDLALQFGHAPILERRET